MLFLKNVIFPMILISVVTVECNIEESIKRRLFNIYRKIAIRTREFQNKPVTYRNVTYYLYTRYNPDQYIQLNPDNLDLFLNKKIVFFIHGWTSSKDIPWYTNLKNAFLKMYGDYFIVQVDWKDPADQKYFVSSINASDVAKIITHLILDLIVIRGALLDRLILIGHSLGGQITGLVGKYFYNMTDVKLPRIIALDPAGPLFNLRPEDERLNKHDADIVQVIHTDGGILGFKAATGTIDFFLNGGSDQPGCWDINFFNITTYTDPIYCDHRRAYQYFVEAILNPRDFIATECSDWESYKASKCDKNKKVSMGDITVNAQGNFYLETKT